MLAPKLPKQGRIKPELVRRILRYEPETGRLFWKHRPEGPASWNSRYSGREAFTAFSAGGYRVGRINRRCYYAHRIIYLMVHGRTPENDIDHINGDRSDNRIENLRDVTRSVNQRNKIPSALAKSGNIGVHWRQELGKWASVIGVDGETINIGVYANKEDAIAARRDAEHHFGFTERHGGAR